MGPTFVFFFDSLFEDRIVKLGYNLHADDGFFSPNTDTMETLFADFGQHSYGILPEC